MGTCSDHDETIVVYTGRSCPVCKMQDELDDAQQEIDDAADEIKDLQKDIEEAKVKIDDLEKGVKNG